MLHVKTFDFTKVIKPLMMALDCSVVREQGSRNLRFLQAIFFSKYQNEVYPEPETDEEIKA